MELITFTNDSLEGFENEELRIMIDKYNSKMKSLCKEFVSECYKKNIESASADGWIVYTLINNLSNARLDLSYENILNKKFNMQP